MTTPDERYLLAKDTCTLITELSKNLKAIGIYNEVEYKAVAEILLSLGLAMKILDPESYETYIAEVKREYTAKNPGIPTDKTGQYL